MTQWIQPDPEIIVDKLKCCSTSEEIAPLVITLDVALTGRTGWPNPAFMGVLSLLRQSEFLAFEDSWRLVDVISRVDNWNTLTLSQKEELRGVLVMAFSRFAHWMGAFITVEIIGGLYADEGACDALVRLCSPGTSPGRELVPHGLELLAKKARSADLRERARTVLRELLLHDDPAVRSEAALALRDLPPT
jgi:hypothetical protein